MARLRATNADTALTPDERDAMLRACDAIPADAADVVAALYRATPREKVTHPLLAAMCEAFDRGSRAKWDRTWELRRQGGFRMPCEYEPEPIISLYGCWCLPCGVDAAIAGVRAYALGEELPRHDPPRIELLIAKEEEEIESTWQRRIEPEGEGAP